MRYIKDPLDVEGRRYPIATVLNRLASQENCDGEPHDQMVQAADYINELEAATQWRDPVKDPPEDAQHILFFWESHDGTLYADAGSKDGDRWGNSSNFCNTTQVKGWRPFPELPEAT